MQTASEQFVDDVRTRLLAQLDGQAESAIVTTRELAAWVVRCTDVIHGPIYRWAIIGGDDRMRSDSRERYMACDDAARALAKALQRQRAPAV